MMRVSVAALAALFTFSLAGVEAAPARKNDDTPNMKQVQKAQPKKKRRVGSSTLPNLTPIQPGPMPGVVPLPPSARIEPAPAPAPIPQSPYLGSRGAYPVPSRVPGESFGDRAARCQHGATVSGVPGSERGSYVHNCL